MKRRTRSPERSGAAREAEIAERLADLLGNVNLACYGMIALLVLTWVGLFAVELTVPHVCWRVMSVGKKGK